MRRIAASLARAGVLAALAACGGPTAGRPGWVAADADLLLAVAEQRDDRAALYEVGREGRIAFGGGSDALAGRVTWEGVMGQADQDELRGLLERHGWFAADPPSAGGPATHVYRATVRSPGGDVRRLRVVGPSPPMDAILAVCDRAARRFEPVMRQLPRAGPQDR